MANSEKITPFLWFNRQAQEAADFYTSVFPNSRTGAVVRNGDEVLVVEFWLDGQKFSALNGGLQFQINPSISFFVLCETDAEIDRAWQQLSDRGTVLMPLETYPWSARYGWVQDRFGVSWQLSLGQLEEVGGQKFTPTLMFGGSQQGRAEEALRFYTGLFDDSSVHGILRYEAGEPGPTGQVKHAQFTLNGQTFMAMDSGAEQPFTFSEAVSLYVNCRDQAEVDRFWNQLTADGGAESQCWLKDKFGVSWQIVPEALPRLLGDPDPAVAERAMIALMKMQKIEIAKLTEDPGAQPGAVTVETMVKAPVEKAWALWTGPRHIEQWNNASADWHTPKAVNDLRAGGTFVYTMAARDGSVSFDFNGVYDDVLENRRLAYTIADGRKVDVQFYPRDGGTHIVETFETENTHTREQQREGWQAILDNFKRYAESQG